MDRDLTYISAHVEVSTGLPIEAQLDPATGLLRLRLGRACPVTLNVDQYGLSRLRTVLDQGEAWLAGAVAEPDLPGHSGTWEPG